jgi:hypothetical protein
MRYDRYNMNVGLMRDLAILPHGSPQFLPGQAGRERAAFRPRACGIQAASVPHSGRERAAFTPGPSAGSGAPLTLPPGASLDMALHFRVLSLHDEKRQRPREGNELFQLAVVLDVAGTLPS